MLTKNSQRPEALLFLAHAAAYTYRKDDKTIDTIAQSNHFLKRQMLEQMIEGSIAMGYTDNFPARRHLERLDEEAGLLRLAAPEVAQTISTMRELVEKEMRIAPTGRVHLTTTNEEYDKLIEDAARAGVEAPKNKEERAPYYSPTTKDVVIPPKITVLACANGKDDTSLFNKIRAFAIILHELMHSSIDKTYESPLLEQKDLQEYIISILAPAIALREQIQIIGNYQMSQAAHSYIENERMDSLPQEKYNQINNKLLQLFSNRNNLIQWLLQNIKTVEGQQVIVNTFLEDSTHESVFSQESETILTISGNSGSSSLMQEDLNVYKAPGGIDLDSDSLDMEVRGSSSAVFAPAINPSFDPETFQGFYIQILELEEITDPEMVLTSKELSYSP